MDDEWLEKGRMEGGRKDRKVYRQDPLYGECLDHAMWLRWLTIASKFPKDQEEAVSTRRSVLPPLPTGCGDLGAGSCGSPLALGAHDLRPSGPSILRGSETSVQRRVTHLSQRQSAAPRPSETTSGTAFSCLQTPPWLEGVKVLPTSEESKFLCFSPTRSGLISRKLLNSSNPG